MRVAVLVAAGLMFAGCGAGKTVTTAVTSTKTVTRTVTQTTPQPGPLSQTEHAQYYGQIASITQADAKRYLLVLEPEFFLVGATANVAHAQQQGTQCAPLSCPGVEDDHLVVPAGPQKLTFVLPAKTTGTVLTPGGGNFQDTKVSAAQLASLVGGAKTPKLIEPLVSGVWLAVDVDRVTSFAQQFQP
jgi:hypothetical protein